MAVKQISQISIKKGSINYLPDSLVEAEMCFTTDTGEIFIGAPNFGPVQYRSSSVSGGKDILPYRNIKILTEFDAVKTITGDIYFQGPLLNVVFPITETKVDLYTFTEGNTIIASYSLYDGNNVNVVGDLYISTFNNVVTVCVAGQRASGITFSGYINDSKQVVLQGINETTSIYTLYMSAKCWNSELATWSGTKGNGINPTCAGDGTSVGDEYLHELKDVKLTSLADKNFLQYNATDDMWENVTINYSDISGTPPSTPVAISECTDVKLTDLSDNQVLQYNATDKMWENVNTPASTAKWIVQNNIVTAGSSSSDSTVLNTDPNIFIVTSAAIVMDNSITEYSVSGTTSHYERNTGTAYSGPYPTTPVSIPLTGGSGTGASVNIDIYQGSKLISGIFDFVANETTQYIIGGTITGAGTTQNGDKYNSISGYYIELLSGDVTIVSSTTTTSSATFSGDNFSGNLRYATNTVLPVYYPTQTPTSTYWTQAGTITMKTYTFYDTIKDVISISNGGTGYKVNDVIPITLDGTPETLTSEYDLTVTAVKTTPPTGITIPNKNEYEMIMVSNKSNNSFYIYPESGTINGNENYLVSSTVNEVKLVQTDSKTETWIAF